MPVDCDPLKPLTVSVQRTTGGSYYELQVGVSIVDHNKVDKLRRMTKIDLAKILVNRIINNLEK